MTNEEFDKLCSELMAQGLTEKDILGVILQMFEDGKIDVEDMKKLAGARGYELTEEFLSKVEAPETPVAAEEGAPEGITEEEIEDAQEFEPGEEKAEESEEEEAESTGEEKDSKEEDEPEESEEDEKEKARKLFNID